MYNRGDIYWCELTDDNGVNIQKGIRPVLVVQNDLGNYVSPVTIICPITSKIEKINNSIHVKISKEKYNINLDSIILVEQIQTINKDKLGLKIDSLTDEDIYRLDLKLKRVLKINKTKVANHVEKLKERLLEINGIIKYIHKYKLFSCFDFELLTERSNLLKEYNEFKVEYSERSVEIDNSIDEVNILLKDFKEYYNHRKHANFV